MRAELRNNEQQLIIPARFKSWPLICLCCFLLITRLLCLSVRTHVWVSFTSRSGAAATAAEQLWSGPAFKTTKNSGPLSLSLSVCVSLSLECGSKMRWVKENMLLEPELKRLQQLWRTRGWRTMKKKKKKKERGEERGDRRWKVKWLKRRRRGKRWGRRRWSRWNRRKNIQRSFSLDL